MSKPTSGYRWLEHTADVGAELRGESLEGLFETAAEALTELVTDRSTVRERTERRFLLSAPDLEQLLVRWLTELIACFEIDNLVFHRFSVKMTGPASLEARAFGEAFETDRHPFRTGVKAVTYHQLAVRQVDGGWEATVIFDV